MTQLHLAYCLDNLQLADILEANLPGLECVRHTNVPGQPAGQMNLELQESQGPVVLLVTDNFMKSEACMAGALGMLLSLMRQNRILPVIADGIERGEDGEEKPVETHIDRVINAIQYMNYWQQHYLSLSDEYNHAEDEVKAALYERLQELHSTADQTGEFISALRDAEYMTWRILEEAHFSDVYHKLGIPQPTHSAPVPPPPVEIPVPVAPAPAPIVPPLSGPVMFTPATPEEHLPPLPDTEPFDVNHHLIKEQETETPAAPFNSNDQYRDTEIEQTIKDAQSWIARGNPELGLEVFQLAVQQYPNHPGLSAAWEKAKADQEFAASQPEEKSDESAAYEAAGDSAYSDNDFLMAKYCWDRAAESNPKLTGIWKKLGLLTSDHLEGYRETSIIYLQKAREADPSDTLILEKLQSLGVATTISSAPQPAAEIAPPVITSQPDPEPAEVPESVIIPIQESPVVSEPPVVSMEIPTAEPVAKPVMGIPSKNEVVLITGATSGIGRATARVFAREGYKLIITGRRVEKLHEVREALENEFGATVLPLIFDVRDANAVESTLTALPEGWQNVDILINNAGLAKGLSPIHEGSLSHWETMIDTNIKGLLYVSRIISGKMVARKKGHIINLSSSAGKETYANGNVYCATKFAVEALTKSMRLDLHQYGIRVSQVSPGHVEETEFAINRFDGDAQRAKIYNDFQPLKASDVAEAIWFMVSRPAHVNIQDIAMFGTQQASATVIDRSGR